MKINNKLAVITLTVMAGLALSSCDLDEEPMSSASTNMVFSSESGLKTYMYSFYNVLPDRLSAFTLDATSDYGVKSSVTGMEVGAYTSTTSSSWSWYALRNINFFLQNNNNGSVSATVRNNYNGIARLFRARFYFEKLKTYGPVPWIDKVFNDSDDPDLYNQRDPRDTIITHILEDLDYAAKNIMRQTATTNSTLVNKWTALAYKSRVCLFEAAWRKYHANDEFDIARTGCTKYTPQDLYKMAAEAAKEVMDNSPYRLYTAGSYANGRGAYRALFTSDNAITSETMLSIATDASLGMGASNWWYNSSTKGVQLSMSRKFEMTYLNKDGSPYREKNEDGSYKTFKEETTDRDTRLNQTIRAYDYTCKDNTGNYVPMTVNFKNNLTGYQFTKYVIDDESYNNSADNTNDYPLMRYAEVLLNYAEAKAELGTLTNDDWAKTIGALRARAGITGGTDETGTLTTKPKKAEPYIAAYYPGVTDPSVLEIRRERAIELCLEGFRLDDLKRWNMCQLFVNDPWEGIYIPALNTPLDLNGDGTYDAYFYTSDKIPDSKYNSIGVYVGKNKNNINNVVQHGTGYVLKYNIAGRSWPDREYLFPIPQVVIQKNPNLTQNPGWENY